MKNQALFASTGSPLIGHGGPVQALACTAQGDQLASCDNLGVVRRWRPETGESAGDSIQAGCHAWCLAYSPSGRELAVGDEQGRVLRWDSQTGQARSPQVEGHLKTVHQVLYAADGESMLSCSADGFVTRWSAAGRPLMSRDLGVPVHSLAVSPDGSQWISGTETLLQRWDARTDRPLGKSIDWNGHMDGLCYSPDGKAFAHIHDNRLQQWEAETGRVLWKAAVHPSEELLCACYTPDGRELVTCSDGGRIHCWNAQTGEMLGAPIQGSQGLVQALAFTPEGLLFTGSENGSIGRWRGRAASLPLSAVEVDF